MTRPPHSYLRTIIVCLLLGAAISVAVHLFFASQWPSYTASISSERLAQTGGRLPPVHMLSTKPSLIHASIVLFACGLAIAFASRADVLFASSMFAIGAGILQIALGVAGSGMGNLWPFAFAAYFLASALPIALGAAMMSGMLRARSALLHRR